MTWVHLWQPWLNMSILIIPRIPILMRRNRRRERRTMVQRYSITTREAMGIMVSAKRIIQILWLTLMCSVVKVNRPSAVAG